MSLREIAQKAGVSHMTVSRIINKDPQVAQETFERVQEVMREMNYTPPPLRERFKPRTRKSLGIRTETIALLFPDPQAEAMGTPLAAQLALGLDRHLHNFGLDLIVTHLRGPNSLPNCIKRRDVDGIVVRGGDLDPTLLSTLGRFARVWLLRRPKTDPESDLVGPDEAMFGQMAAERFLSEGYRELACLNPYKTHPAFRKRVSAFLSTAKAGGATVLDVSTSEKNGAELMKRFLSVPNRPNGVFVTGATSYATERSLAEELLNGGHTQASGKQSIFCTSSSVFIKDFRKRVTILDSQACRMGESAAEVLLQRMQYPDAPPKTILMKPLLVES